MVRGSDEGERNNHGQATVCSILSCAHPNPIPSYNKAGTCDKTKKKTRTAPAKSTRDVIITCSTVAVSLMGCLKYYRTEAPLIARRYIGIPCTW